MAAAILGNKNGGGVGMRLFVYRLGRFLQLVGLVMLPAAVAANLGEPQLSLGQSLAISSAGVAVFVLGYLLQRAGAPR